MKNIEVQRAILEKIKEYNRIIIFRHLRPDGDAVGSTKGLQALLKLNFPEKDCHYGVTLTTLHNDGTISIEQKKNNRYL